MSDMVYLFVAYAIIWTGIILYVFKLQRDQKNMIKQLTILKEVQGEGRKRGD